MRRSSGIVPIIAILFVACVAGVWVWYRGTPAPAPATVTAAPSAAASPASQPTAVTYVPVQQPVVKATASPAHTAAPTVAPATAARATSPPATAAPPMPSPTPQALNAGSTPGPTEVPIEAATIAPGHIAPPVIREDPNAPPRILAMTLSTPVAHGGETVIGTVETSSNVASVEARIGGYSSSMQKVGVGKFRMAYTVPKLPFFLRRTWNIEVVARNPRGDAVRTSIPITIR